MHKEGRFSRKGRFIKKDSTLGQAVQIKKYSFEEICQVNLIFRDNPRQNIIHERLHDSNELEKEIITKTSVDEIFLPHLSQDSPIIFPRNFTEDWLEEKNKTKSQKTEKFEDDDFLEENQEIQKKDAVTEETNEKLALKDSSIPEQKENKIDSHNSTEPSISSIQENFIIKKEDATKIETATKKEETVEEKTTNTPEASKTKENAEDNQLKNEALAQKEKELDELHQKLQNSTAQLFLMNEEFKKVKKDILLNTEENFYQLAGALFESLLGKKIKNEPQIFSQILSKIVKDSIKEDKFTIYVDKETHELLSKVSKDDIKEKIKSDDKLVFGNFRIESDLSTIEGNIKNMIDDFLEQTKIDLFEEESK